MTRRDHPTWTFSDDPLRGILVALGWSDVAEPERSLAEHSRSQAFAGDTVAPLRAASHVLMSATTMTRPEPEDERRAG